MSLSFAGQDKPVISVVMPVYNSELYVTEAIQSILAQTYPHFEFIIVDDGSTDGSAEIVRRLAARDARIRPVFLHHRGQSSALNDGIALAKGQFIAYMDNDDIALPDRLAVQYDWMKRFDLDICGACLKTFGEENRILWFPEAHDDICHELLFRVALHHGCSMVRADIAKSNPFNEQVHALDYEMFVRLAPLYRMGNVPRVLLKWRSHANQKHLQLKSEFHSDLEAHRFPYFRTLFPGTTTKDLAAIACVAGNGVGHDLQSLECGGRWLIRFAQTPENFVRRRMAERWRAACMRSAHLGLGSYRLFRRIAPRFGNYPVSHHLKLWLACALRLKSGSRRKNLLRNILAVMRKSLEAT